MLKKLSFFGALFYLWFINCEIVVAQTVNQNGWNLDIKEQSGMPYQINATYIITKDDIDDEKVEIDLTPVLKYLNDHISKNKQLVNTKCKLNLTIRNESGQKITFNDYTFTTNSYQDFGDPIDSDIIDIEIRGEGGNTIALGNILSISDQSIKEQAYDINLDKSLTIPVINTYGFDKELLRTSSLFYRTQSSAMIALLGEKNLTVQNIANIDTKVKDKISFKNIHGEEIELTADSTRTYGQYVKVYYDIKSWDELSNEELYQYFNSEVTIRGYDSLDQDGLGVGYKYIGINDLNDNISDHFKRWGKAIVTKYNDEYVFSEFYLLESDVELQQLAYKYLYNNIISFTLNNKIMSLDNFSTLNNNYSLFNYINKDNDINRGVYQLFNYGDELNNGDTLNLPNIELGVLNIKALAQNDLLDFGLSLSYDVLEEYHRDVILIQYGQDQNEFLENMIYRLQYKDEDNNWKYLDEYNYLKSDDQGLIMMSDLDIGDYRLVAKLTPAGFKEPNSIEFSVNEVDDSTPLLLTCILETSDELQNTDELIFGNNDNKMGNIIKYSFVLIIVLVSVILTMCIMKKVSKGK